PSSWNSVLSASSLAWCLLPKWRLAGEGDAGNEDVDLPHFQSQHPLRRLDDVGLDRGRDLRQLRIGLHRDEDLEVDRAVGFDVHAHAAVRGLPANPIAEVPRGRLVHAPDALDLA